MKKSLVAIALGLLLSMPTFANEFGGDDGEFCQNVRVVEVEVIKYVEVPEFVEVEVPVYLPSEEDSEVIWDAAASRLYAYNIQVWDGPQDTGMTLEEAVWSYSPLANKWELESVK